jgi:hypothetical protein
MSSMSTSMAATPGTFVSTSRSWALILCTWVGENGTLDGLVGVVRPGGLALLGLDIDVRSDEAWNGPLDLDVFLDLALSSQGPSVEFGLTARALVLLRLASNWDGALGRGSVGGGGRKDVELDGSRTSREGRVGGVRGRVTASHAECDEG